MGPGNPTDREEGRGKREGKQAGKREEGRGKRAWGLATESERKEKQKGEASA
jgi:hypothetical protein